MCWHARLRGVRCACHETSNNTRFCSVPMVCHGMCAGTRHRGCRVWWFWLGRVLMHDCLRLHVCARRCWCAGGWVGGRAGQGLVQSHSTSERYVRTYKRECCCFASSMCVCVCVE